MQPENYKLLSLKEYISENIGDDCGNWEYVHEPYIKSLVGNLNEDESEVFSNAIWDWDNSIIYELADPIIFGENKYLKQDYLYCRIFSEINDFDNLDYLAQNLGPCFYSIKPEDYDIEMFKKIRFNLLFVLEKTTDNEGWKNNYRKLLVALDEIIS